MRVKGIFLFACAVMVTGLANAQVEDFYVKVNAGLQVSLGKVYIAGTNKLFYGDSFIGGRRTNEGLSNTVPLYKRIGISFGANVAPKLRAGIGVDVDIYEIGGEGQRLTMPILLETDYVIKERRKHFFMVYSSTGYSFPIEDDVTMGAVKLEGGVAYEFMPKGYGWMGFGARLGYSYLHAHKVHQHVLTHTHANSYSQTGLRFVKANVHAVPITIYVRF